MATFSAAQSPGDTQDTADAAGPEFESVPSSARARVFLAYRATPESIRLAQDLHAQLEGEYEVTFAPEYSPGIEWSAHTEERLGEADFFVALMTQDACDSTQSIYLPYEVETATKHYLEHARPVIIPVRVAHLEPYDYRIGACLTRFQEIEVGSPEDLGDLVKRALAGRPAPPRNTVSAVLGDYALSQKDHLRLAAAHVNLPALQSAWSGLEAGDTVWLIGEPGVTNYAARSLAAKMVPEGRDIYLIPRGKSWQEVEKTFVGEAFLVFLDALPSSLLSESEDTAIPQLAALARLLSRRNRILLTAPEEAFEDAHFLMRRFGFRHYRCERLHHNSYSDESKRHILETSLTALARSGEIGGRQLGLIQRVLAADAEGPQGRAARSILTAETRLRLEQTLKKWAPSDIESFLLYRLPDVSRLTDLAKALQRNATLDDEIHAWFSDLPDSAKCFVLTVALVPGVAAPRTWERHKRIVGKLRSFDSNLALWPLGTARERAAPYVTQDGVLGFLEERIAEAVRREIARSYREYLVELKEELRRWTLGEEPSLPEDLPAVRASVATMIGDAARSLLDDLVSLIELWAGHNDWEVREVAARALERMAADASSQDTAFDLLAAWRVRGQDTQHKVWAAAASYGRIAARDPRAADSRRAFEALGELARDDRERVADAVALAVRKLVSRYPVDELEKVFHSLARQPKAFVQLHLAETINAVRLAEEKAGEQILQAWLGAPEVSLRRVAACSLILQVWDRRWRRRATEALNALLDFLIVDATTLAEALMDAIGSEKQERWRKSGFTTLARLVKLEEVWGTSRLAAALAEVVLERGDHNFLHLLRADGSRFDRFVVAVRAETWNGLLKMPVPLLEALESESRREPVPGEGHRLVALLASQEETRNTLTAALASRFAENHDTVEHVLSWLRSAPQENVKILSVLVRSQALAALLASPPVFATLVQTDLLQASRRDETRAVLVHLAQATTRAHLVRALATAHPAKMEIVESLLSDLLSMSALAGVAREAMQQILADRLDVPPDFFDQLQRMRRQRIWNEAVSALEHLADPSRETSRSRVIKALARERRTRPDDTDALLQDPSLRSRGCLKYLWLRVRVEAILQSLGLASE